MPTVTGDTTIGGVAVSTICSLLAVVVVLIVVVDVEVATVEDTLSGIDDVDMVVGRGGLGSFDSVPHEAMNRMRSKAHFLTLLPQQIRPPAGRHIEAF